MRVSRPASAHLRLGLVGHPIARSLSPLLHEAALRHAGIAGRYALYDVADADGLTAVIARLRAGEIDGLNVTVPHKLDALRACDVRTAIAETVGAANTLVRRDDGAVVGWNTDLPGLIASIADAWGDAAARGATLVIGAGGAAPAAVLAAHALGAREVRVWNRTPERAVELVTRLGVGSACGDRIAAADGVGLVIQASNHGMDLAGDDLAAAVADARAVIARTAPGARVVDLVYRPRPTAWRLAASALGRASIDGLGMLVHQAALAFELWTGARADVAIAARADAGIVAAMRAALTAASQPD